MENDIKKLISKILKNVKLKESPDLAIAPAPAPAAATISIGFELAKILSKLNGISAYPYKLDHNTLFVRCANSVVMMELILNEPLIIEELNKYLKDSEKIKHIKFFLDNKKRKF